MKGKKYLFIGLVFGVVTGWALGFLRLPYIEKNYSFLLGFITALEFIALALLLLAAWNRHFLPRFTGKKTAAGDGKNNRTYAFIGAVLAGFLVLGVVVNGLTAYRLKDSCRIQMQHEQEKIQEMAETLAAVKKNDLGPLLHNLLEDIGEELKSNPRRALSDATIDKIVALSLASKPFKYIQGDSLSKQAYSPERGHLLQALTLMNIDSGSFARIKQQALFASADLRKTDLKKMDLSGINLRAANLEGADLSGTNLEGADLKEANLWGANLNRAILSHTDMERADLRWAQMNESNMTLANIDGANLSNAQLRKANLTNATFKWAQSVGALFNEAILTGVDMAGTNLKKVNLSQAGMRYSNLRSIDLSEADLVGVRLDKAIVDQEWQEKLKKWQPEGGQALRESYSVVNDTVDKWKRPSYRLKKNE